jgi:phage/plasmid-like protein (TIGR03299 family)
MSHELEMVDGKASMAYVGETPWHGIGKKVHHDLTPQQMMEEAGLNWSVEKVPLSGHFHGQLVETDKFALIRNRDCKLLTVVGDDWEPVQNSEAFEFFHEFIINSDMEMSTAGSLKGGTLVWALARVKESFTVFGKDRIDSYLLFTNPHIYGRCVDVRFTPVRAVCWNTVTLALNTKSDVSVRLNHRKAFDPNMVKETLGIANNKLGKYKEMAEFLGSKRMTDESFNNFVRELFPSSSKNEDKFSRPAKIVKDVLYTQPGTEFAEGTWWQGWNAVTRAVDHNFANNQDNRLASAWYGGGQKKKLEALEKAIEYAEVA